MASTNRLLSFLFLGAIAAAISACASPAAQECGATGIYCPSGTHCAAAQGICISDKVTCGDAHLDPAEVCDDGNTLDGDGCAADCKSDETCGNGITDVKAGEVCDDSNTLDGDGCAASCRSNESCGNGVTDKVKGEVCDDGNQDDADDCSADCKSDESCGNSIVDRVVGEICDDGNTTDGDACSHCTAGAGCGNGIVDKDAQGNPLEECDDGNIVADDDCTSCFINRCGDGIPHTKGVYPEECDGGSVEKIDGFPRTVIPAETTACNIDCTVPSCGDGKVNHSFKPMNAPGVEQCDNGGANGDSADCTKDCQVNTCGDGHFNTVGPSHIEGCDDGDRDDSNDCTNACAAKSCGDGIVGSGEECDLGASNSDTGACLVNCRLATCGDSNVRAGFEECDGTAGLQPCSSTCHQQKCGNGIIDPGEQCDDANLADDDGCSSICAIEFCGDNKKNNVPHEVCDTAGASTTCDIDCTAPQCGDGIVNHTFQPLGAPGPEQCDPPSATNGCSAACQFERCGNNTIDPGEECDGQAVGGFPCSADCHLERCGNGIVDPSEQCDLGSDGLGVNQNTTASACPSCQLARCGDGKVQAVVEECDGVAGLQPCSSTCHQQKCGNGITDPGEQCDDAGTADNDGCSSSCVIEFCGDNQTNNNIPAIHEVCDTAGASLTCDIDCTAPVCGDSIVNHSFTPLGAPGSEQCDPPSATNGCSAACQFERCGNNIVDPGEECDGLSIGGLQCSADCHLEQCGNGILDPGEQCDDDNANNQDGCTNGCLFARCGDNIVETGVEECDGGNAIGGDGCSATCRLEACGNGIVDSGEACDDGNALTCGSCSATCQVVTSAGAATGLIFAAAGADMITADTFTVDDGVGTSVTFEFTTGSSGGNRIRFDAVDTNATMASNIANAINRVGLQIVALPIGSTGIVTLTHRQLTSSGTQDIVNNVLTPNFGVFGMSGGQAGDCVAGNGCSVNDDCASHVCKADHTCQ